ncbi:unnamed protein product [Rodentolepis nana]|uniref:Homeobox domain-containing protein n=1 Tax=Rodentolepis nana TaxID=102285 RepID=A0A0R3TDX5_RODNA|nr:unnamed protein product [Rodentolepis nana]
MGESIAFKYNPQLFSGPQGTCGFSEMFHNGRNSMPFYQDLSQGLSYYPGKSNNHYFKSDENLHFKAQTDGTWDNESNKVYANLNSNQDEQCHVSISYDMDTQIKSSLPPASAMSKINYSPECLPGASKGPTTNSTEGTPGDFHQPTPPLPKEGQVPLQRSPPMNMGGNPPQDVHYQNPYQQTGNEFEINCTSYPRNNCIQGVPMNEYSHYEYSRPPHLPMQAPTVYNPVAYGPESFNPPMPNQEYSYAPPPQNYVHGHPGSIVTMPQYQGYIPHSVNAIDNYTTPSYGEMVSQNLPPPRIHQQIDGPRRKNASRKATATLKEWLNEHKSNPYPTKTEKSTLASTTGMSSSQISTWFANARRRLKKENKMTWAPRTTNTADSRPRVADMVGGDDLERPHSPLTNAEGVEPLVRHYPFLYPEYPHPHPSQPSVPFPPG